jgi:hypothetical protein
MLIRWRSYASSTKILISVGRIEQQRVISKEYQSYDCRRKDLAFGGRWHAYSALTHGRVLGAGFRMSIPLLFGFNSWPCARYAGYRVRPSMCMVVGWDVNSMKKQQEVRCRFDSYGRSRLRRDGMQVSTQSATQSA